MGFNSGFKGLNCGSYTVPKNVGLRTESYRKTNGSTLSQTAVHYHKRQYTITNGSTLSQTAVHYHKRQYTITNCSTLSQTAVHYHKRQWFPSIHFCFVERVGGKPPGCYLLGFLSNKNNITKIKQAVILHNEVRDRRQDHLSAVTNFGRSQWPCCLRCGSEVARLLGLWVQIPVSSCRSVCCCECCMLTGRGPCVGLITRPEESYRVWCV